MGPKLHWGVCFWCFWELLLYQWWVWMRASPISSLMIILCTDTEGPPPYPPLSFDHVLLDAPCSALGQRPSAANSMRVREVSSYPVLQRKIFTEVCWHAISAVLTRWNCRRWLYSGMAALWSSQHAPWPQRRMSSRWRGHCANSLNWLLLHKCVVLCTSCILWDASCSHLQEPYLGGPGRPGQGLDEEQRRMVQRFDPGNIVFDQVDSDCIGFFIAKFIKNSIKWNLYMNFCLFNYVLSKLHTLRGFCCSYHA